MVDIFLRTLPFFAIIGLGFGAGRVRFFSDGATEILTRFVFFFALPAMLFRFAATLPFEEIFNGRLIVAYLWGTAAVYGIATLVGFLRGLDARTTAVEAQCAAIGNVGFLGIPMLAVLFGQAAVGPVMLVLATDLVVFSSLIVILMNTGGQGVGATLRLIGIGLLKNPMIVAISLGLCWAALRMPIPVPMMSFLSILGGAATPGALFVIGMSLAGKSAERLAIAGWLSVCKLFVHPALVGLAVFVLFPVDAFTAGVVVAAAALPVAGNVYMLAAHYRVAPERASTAILISTLIGIVTIPVIIALAQAG